MVAVVLYCVARAFVPALRPDGHRRDLDAWHLVMAAAMAVMLLAGHGRTFAVLGLLVFAVGLAWSGLRAVRRTGRAAYVRLGIGCAAMAVMLVPAATLAPATAATPTAAGHDHGMHHDHAAAASASGAGPLALPSLLVVLLLALVAVLVRRPPARGRTARGAGRGPARRRLRGAHGRRDGRDAGPARLARADPYQRSA